MFKPNTLAAAAAVLTCGLAASPMAQAVTQTRVIGQTGSNLCKLSVPTIDSAVRPRATGFRNEGTTSVFVICTFDSPPGQAGGTPDLITSAGIYLYSMDGANHAAVSCTGVNSLTDGTGVGVIAPQFVVKTYDVNNSGSFGAFGVPFFFYAADFGGSSTIPTYAGTFSITCNIPPQVGIKVGFSNSTEDVGT